MKEKDLNLLRERERLTVQTFKRWLDDDKINFREHIEAALKEYGESVIKYTESGKCAACSGEDNYWENRFDEAMRRARSAEDRFRFLATKESADIIIELENSRQLLMDLHSMLTQDEFTPIQFLPYMERMEEILNAPDKP